MLVQSVRFGLAAVSLCAFGLATTSGAAGAQEAGNSSIASKEPVSLQVDGADLYYTLKLLFQKGSANFTLDNRLKGIPVTVSLKSVPFTVALESVLRASNLPLTWTLESGVYSIVEKREDLEANSLPLEEEGISVGTDRRLVYLPPTAFVLSGIDVANALGSPVIHMISWSGANVYANPFGMIGFGGMGMGMGGMGFGAGAQGGVNGAGGAGASGNGPSGRGAGASFGGLSSLLGGDFYGHDSQGGGLLLPGGGGSGR